MKTKQATFVGENISIWRLSIPKLQTAFPNIFTATQPLESCKNLTDRIITSYNNLKEKGLYEPIFPEGHVNWENEEGFSLVQLVGYVATYSHEFKYAKELIQLGADKELFESSQKHYLFFLYGTITKIKKVVFFAFTTHQSYNVFKRYAEFNFPAHIAKTILKDDSITEIKNRHTVGPLLAKQTWYKEGSNHKTNPDSLETISVALKVKLNPFAKIIQLFDNIALNTMVHLTRGSICFYKRYIPIKEFPTLIAHLTTPIESKTETGLTENTSPPKDNFSWLDYLTPVENKEERNSCMEVAKKLLISAIKHPKNSRTFNLCPKYFDDYWKSQEIICEYGNTEINRWNYLPTTDEILESIHKSNMFDDIDKIYIIFQRNGRPKYVTLADCFDGELNMYGARYFHACGLWYKPNANYLLQVQNALNSIIMTSLIIPSDERHLKQKWQKGTPIKDNELRSFKTKLSCLKEKKGSYLDSEDKIVCRVIKAHFFGRSTTYKQFHQLIQEKLNKRRVKVLTRNDLEELGINKDNAQKLFREMHKEKKILDEKNRVVIPYYPGIPEDLKTFLEVRSDHHDEGLYNASFHETDNFLVGDTVIPDGIELFDLLHFTDDGPLHLFHVKEGIDGDHARAACSQVRNSAKKLKATLSGNDDVLKKFCDFVYNENKPVCYRLRKKHKNELDFRKWFMKLFTNSPRERITFVLTFLDTHSPERLLHESPEYLSGSKTKIVISSTIAKLEIIGLEREIRSMGFDFKICQIKREGEGDPTVTEELPAPEPPDQFNLSEYQFGVQCLKRQQTIGDGNCAFHSALGTPLSSYQYNSPADTTIRQEFLNKLVNTLTNEWMKAELAPLYENTIKNLLGKIIRGQLNTSDKIFAQNIIINEKPLQQYIQEKVAAIFDSEKTPLDFLRILDPKIRQFSTEEEFLTWLSDGTNGAEYLLTSLGIPRLKEIAADPKMSENNFHTSKEALDELLKIEDKCYEAWHAAMLNTSYYLSDDELAMIGYAYNKSIVLIETAEDGTNRVCEICSANDQDRVFIYASGNHYERCTEISP